MTTADRLENLIMLFGLTVVRALTKAQCVASLPLFVIVTGAPNAVPTSVSFKSEQGSANTAARTELALQRIAIEAPMIAVVFVIMAVSALQKR